MTNEINKPVVKTYWIARNGTISYGVCMPDQQTTSGMPNFESFIDKVLWINRLIELGVGVWYINNKEDGNIQHGLYLGYTAPINEQAIKFYNKEQYLLKLNELGLTENDEFRFDYIDE